MDFMGKQEIDDTAPGERRASRDTISGPLRWPIMIAALAMGGFQLYNAYSIPFMPLVQNAAHVLFGLTIGFLTYSIFPQRPNSTIAVILDLVFAACGSVILIYLIIYNVEIVMRPAQPLPVEIILGTGLVILMLELGRRTLGWSFTILCIAAIAYALLGQYMPQLIAHQGVDYEYFIYYLYETTEGIFGAPIAVSANFVYLFILFGTLLFASGTGKFLIDFANGIAGRSQGGPAKVAVISSALFGTISGSSVANVVTTGSFTIPLMKSIGYPSFYAGAVEAAASTGGLIMPPVMGAAAFLMAEMTGLSYASICIAAALPAVLYYYNLMLMVHFRAIKLNLKPLKEEDIPRLGKVLRGGWTNLLPVGVLIYFLIICRASPMKSALWAVVAIVPSALIVLEDKRKILSILMDGITRASQVAVPVVAACGLAGIVIASLNLSGLTTKFGTMLLYIAGNSLPAVLGVTAIFSLILGTGLSAIVAYILPAVLMGPVLTQMGVPLMAAHLFIFYWSIIAHITPPVALAAYAAAGIAEADPFKTGLMAVRLALPGFILPFMFITSPSLLMIGSNHLFICYGALTAILGVTLLAMALEGWCLGPLPKWQRLLMALGGLGLIDAGLLTDLFGFCVLIGIYAIQRKKRSLSKI